MVWRGSTCTTGAPVAAFVATLSARGSEVAASNSTVYVGGRFTTVNGAPRASLAAVDATTGALDTDFVNNLSGGIGNGGNLTVQQLVLTRDLSKLLVVFTGRQVNGQDRYGIALINTETKDLLPWRTRLYQDNLQFTGGTTGINAGAIAPDDEFFVVGNAWGDRPPIGDTVIAFPIDGGDDVKPRWISRHHDSVYSLAISEKAVYVGGHFGWQESPTSPDPWPGLEDVGLRHRPGPLRLCAGRRRGQPRARRCSEPCRRQGAGVEPGLDLLRGQQGHGGHAPGGVHRR